MTLLKATVLGLGLGLHRANGYLQNPHVVLAAVCDTDAQRLRAFTAAHPDVRGYADYAEMLRRETPDIVNISTPDWMHLEHARQALAADATVVPSSAWHTYRMHSSTVRKGWCGCALHPARSEVQVVADQVGMSCHRATGAARPV